MIVQPLGHRVLIKPQNVEDIDPVYKAAKAAGIEGLDFSERREQGAVDRGIVVAIGETAFIAFGGSPWCTIGDYVAYAKYSGKVIVNPDDPKDKYLVLNDEDIVVKFVGETTND